MIPIWSIHSTWVRNRRESNCEPNLEFKTVFGSKRNQKTKEEEEESNSNVDVTYLESGTINGPMLCVQRPFREIF